MGVRHLLQSLSHKLSHSLFSFMTSSFLRDSVVRDHPCRTLAAQFEDSCHQAALLAQLTNQTTALCLSPSSSPPPYELIVGPSEKICALSGRRDELGLFLAGSAQAGTLVTLYPGTLYSPGSDPVLIPSIMNRFLLMLNNGVSLDGRDSFPSAGIFSSLAARDSYIRKFDPSWLLHRSLVHQAMLKDHYGNPSHNPAHQHQHEISPPAAAGRLPRRLTELLPRALNPLGLGHFVNHFPPDGFPSLVYMSFSVPLDFPAPLSKFLPNVNWSSDYYTPANTLLTCVGLVALRDLKDEELFVDYGFVGTARS